jgi:hypothetical protein
MRPLAHAQSDSPPQLQIRDRRLVCVREARMVEQALALLEKHAPGPRLPPHPPRPARSEGRKALAPEALAPEEPDRARKGAAAREGGRLAPGTSVRVRGWLRDRTVTPHPGPLAR